MLVWSLSGDLALKEREQFYDRVSSMESFARLGFSGPAKIGNSTLIDYFVAPQDGEFQSWRVRVPRVDINPDQVNNSTLIIQTTDTLRH